MGNGPKICLLNMRRWSHKEIEIWAQRCEGCLKQVSGDFELAANGAAPEWGSLICGKNVTKQKRKKTMLQVEFSSLKGVTLEGKSFGLSGDQRSFLCVTQ